MARAKTRSKSKTKRSAAGGWFSHRQLIFVEAVLLVGLGKELLEWLVLEHSGLPAIHRVVLGMFVVASTLGGLVYAAQNRLKTSLERTQKAVRRRVRVPQLLLHAVALLSIFLAYAIFWDEETGALAELALVVRRAAEGLLVWAAELTA